MTEAEALDIAANAAGYAGWRDAFNRAGMYSEKSIRAHAATLIREAELIEQHEALKREVSEAVKQADYHETHGTDDVLHNLRRFIIPAADPLVEKVEITIRGHGSHVVGLPELARLIKGGARITDIKLERLDQ